MVDETRHDGERSRKLEEMKFHDYVEEVRIGCPEEYDEIFGNSKYYSITRASIKYRDELIARAGGGGNRLRDYCCGAGRSSVQAAKLGCIVVGVDISDGRLAESRRFAERENVADRCTFLKMDAENLDFPDNSFDCILCSGVLHHLDLDKAYKELSRVLKPSGFVICQEGLMHNPLIQAYRRRTPDYRTAWETEHILRRSDIKNSGKCFGALETRFFHLFSIAAVPFRKTKMFGPILSFLELVDAVILAIPGVGWLAWQCVFCLSRPKK